MSSNASNWQRASCHPLFATLLLVVMFGGAWCITSSTAARMFGALRSLAGWG